MKIERARPDASAWAVDAIAVLLFAGVGRLSHGEGLSLSGIIDTAMPFLVGVVVAWFVIDRLEWDPYAAKTGLVVLGGAVVVGMALRAVFGVGIALPFIIVATLVLAAFFQGWRLVARRREA